MNNITNNIYNQEPSQTAIPAPAPNATSYELSDPELPPAPNAISYELPDSELTPELERLNYRMKIASSIYQIESNIRDVQARNRFLVCYRLQHKDARFSYNLFGKSWQEGHRKLSFKEYKKLSEKYDFPSIILEIMDERHGDTIRQAKIDAFRMFKECEEV